MSASLGYGRGQLFPTSSTLQIIRSPVDYENRKDDGKSPLDQEQSRYEGKPGVEALHQAKELLHRRERR